MGLGLGFGFGFGFGAQGAARRELEAAQYEGRDQLAVAWLGLGLGSLGST